MDIIQFSNLTDPENYTLLDELGKLDKNVLLKRGTWATLEEILGAVERLLSGSLDHVAICLRGVIGAPPYRHIFKYRSFFDHTASDLTKFWRIKYF